MKMPFLENLKKVLETEQIDYHEIYEGDLFKF